jgi:hypothetical protein
LTEIKWRKSEDCKVRRPDDDVVAIIVCLDPTTQGSVRIWDGENLRGMVGGTGIPVMIIWEAGWKYMSFKEHDIAEIR